MTSAYPLVHAGGFFDAEDPLGLDKPKAFPKEFNVGALTGAAGSAAGGLARSATKSLALSEGLKTAIAGGASGVAEATTMPIAGALQELRWPHGEEFVHSFAFIGGMRAMHLPRLAKNIAEAMPEGVKKLRNIYEKTGKTPVEVAEAAQKDPTVQQDVLAINKDIPGAFAEETLNRLKAGEEVPTEELHGYLPRNWAKAELLERQGPEAVQEGIKNVVESTLQGQPVERLHWKVLRQADAEKLSTDAGIDVQAGLVHSIDPSEVRHALKRHGDQASEIQHGQQALQAGDYLLLPEIVSNYDTVEAVITDKKIPGLKYSKRIGNTFYVVEEIRTGRNELSFTTMWKMDDNKAGIPAPHTPETTAVGPDARSAESLTSKRESTTPRAEVKPEFIDRAENRAASDGLTGLLDGGDAVPELREMFAQDLRELRDLSQERFDGFKALIEGAEHLSPEERQAAMDIYRRVQQEMRVETERREAEAAQAPSNDFQSVDAETFIALREKSKRPEFLTPYTAEEMQGWQHFVTDDGVGFTLTDKMDIIGVINNSGKRGAGENAVIEAIARGGKTLDAVGGHLTEKYYPRFGFREIRRESWSEEHAPKGWNYDKYDTPDIVFFEYPEGLSRDRGDIRRRLEAARGGKSGRGSADTGFGGGIDQRPSGEIRSGMGVEEPRPADRGTGTPERNVTSQESPPSPEQSAATEVKPERISGTEMPAAEPPYFTKIGQNSAGHDVYQTRDGVRTYVQEGMNIEQAGLMAADGAVNTPGELFQQGRHNYLTTEELRAFAAEGKPTSHLADTHTAASCRDTGHGIPVDPNKPVMPADGPLRHQDATPISGVIDALAKAFNVPIRIGKFRDHAHGIYKPDAEVIRLGVANNIKTAVHEVGHHLQNMLFGEISWKPLAPFRAELEPMATKPKAGQSPLPEGFAEFVAKYVTNPKEAQRLAPRFYEHFKTLMHERAPELSQALLDARKAVKRWAEQPAAQEVLSHISIDGRQGEGIIARLFSRDTWDRIYTEYVDRLYPLKRAVDLLAAGEELPADINPYTLARTFAGAKGKATHFIEHSPFRFDTWENVGKPLAETLRFVDNIDEFRAYLVSRRGLELEGRGVNSGIRKDAMRATVVRR